MERPSSLYIRLWTVMDDMAETEAEISLLAGNNGYDSQKDQIYTFYRTTQTTIFRLPTGHCGLRKHLKRLGLASS